MDQTKFPDVDSYIMSFQPDTRQILNQIRSTIRDTAPDAEESISYGMPAYKQNGKPLVYFAAFKNHIGFYATPTGHEAFKEALSVYKQGKGSVQFPINDPMPIKLIEDIVKFRLSETSKNTKQ